MVQNFAKSAFQAPIPILSARRHAVESSLRVSRMHKSRPNQRPVGVVHVVPSLSLEPRSTRQQADANVSRDTPPAAPLESRTASRSHPVIHVASGRALTPVRRPRENAGAHFSEEQPMPSQRRSDMMAPKTTGFWSIVPYMAASAVLLGTGWIAKKRFAARQARLVKEFGQVLVLYGKSPETMREITSEYKGKLGPGILRGAMFSSYLEAFVTDKSITPSAIQDVSIIKRLLNLSDDRIISTVNALGENLKEAPSLLGKVLFISERIISPEKLSGLSLVSLFPYGASTVTDLQRNMLERCFKEYVNDEIDVNRIEEPPAAAASVLRIDPKDAQSLFDNVVLGRIRKREAEEAEMAAAEAEEASKPNAPELDYPARSGEPAKAAVHAFQCSDCGYTLFPAAGREFKFYGDDFVCPTCGAPKDKFVDVNSE